MSTIEKANLALQVSSFLVNLIPKAVDGIKKGMSETKYFKILPEEYEKEVKLAKERKDYGDTFYPNYEDYLDILKQGKDENKMMVIKWERKFSKSNWAAHIIKDGESFNFCND